MTKDKVKKNTNQKPKAKKTNKKVEKQGTGFSKKLKTVLIIICALILTSCLAIDIWYLYIAIFAPKKIVSTTHIVDTLTTADNTKKSFIELNVFRNQNHNGYQGYEIKFNQFLDETKTNLYSYGIQYISKTTDDSNNDIFKFYADKTTRDNKAYSRSGSWPVITEYYHGFGTYDVNSDYYDKFEYQSVDNFETTSLATNTFDSFKIELNKDIYLMKFRGNQDYTSSNTTDEAKKSYLDSTATYTVTSGTRSYLVVHYIEKTTYHSYYDINYFTKLILESLSPLKAGGSQKMVFSLPDMFDYYKYNESTKQYSEDRELNSTKLTQEVSNYYAITVTISNDGIRKSEDSLFNCVNGSSTFTINSEDYINEEFFVGRPVITATLDNFELIKDENDKYNIILKDSFVQRYESYKSKIYLRLNLDYISYFESQGLMSVNSPTLESVRGFKVYKINIQRTGYGG